MLSFILFWCIFVCMKGMILAFGTNVRILMNWLLNLDLNKCLFVSKEFEGNHFAISLTGLIHISGSHSCYMHWEKHIINWKVSLRKISKPWKSTFNDNLWSLKGIKVIVQITLNTPLSYSPHFYMWHLKWLCTILPYRLNCFKVVITLKGL